MVIGWKVAILASVLLLQAHPMRAEVTILETHGVWQDFGGTNGDNQPVCGMSERGLDGRMALIKYFFGADQFEVSFLKPSWVISPKTSVQIVLSFDQNAPWQLSGLGSGNMLSVLVVPSSASAFAHQLKVARSAMISFPGGSEPPWQGNMTGSNAAAIGMSHCITATNERLHPSAPTQPFGTTPTQPYASGPQIKKPTQPFGQDVEPTNL